MKKVKIVLAISVLSVSFADFSVMIPLHQENGGNLPNNSIKIGNNNNNNENWIDIEPIYTDWTDLNTLYNCTNWTPNPSLKNESEIFEQTSNNCNTEQIRTRQNREQETTTLTYRNVGSPIEENQILTNQNATRTYTVALSEWSNSGVLSGCSNWSPNPNTINAGNSFTQTATDCIQPQSRNRNESYIDHKTSENISVLNTIENRSLTDQTSTRSAIGTKPAAVCQDYSWYYLDQAAARKVIVVWSGQQITTSSDNIPYTATTFNKGGYKYTRSTFNLKDGEVGWEVAYYTSCREPI